MQKMQKIACITANILKVNGPC